MGADAEVASGESMNPMLRDCSQRIRTSLMECGDFRQFEPGTLLLRRGEPAAKVILLLQGRLQIDKTSSRGRRQVICTMTPRECGGICVLLLGEK